MLINLKNLMEVFKISEISKKVFALDYQLKLILNGISVLMK